MGRLKDEEVDRLRSVTESYGEHVPVWMVNRPKDVYTGESRHLFGSDVTTTLDEDINIMRKIRCYRVDQALRPARRSGVSARSPRVGQVRHCRCQEEEGVGGATWDIPERTINNTRPRKGHLKRQGFQEETKPVIEYGLRNKREVWKAQEHLRRYRRAARDLLSLMSAGTSEDVFNEKKSILIDHMQRVGLLGPDADIDNVLSLKVPAQLERRLQTVVYRQGLARSPKQARQFITHGHIAINGKE